MTNLLSPTIDELTSYVLGYGDRVSPRDNPTTEVQFVSMVYPMGVFPHRKGMSKRLIIAEALTILTGQFDLDLLTKASPKANRVLFTPQMAYGPRLVLPLANCIRALAEDHSTRRAVAHISRPEDNCSKNTPCTTNFQFFIRNGFLDMSVNMRSNDLVFGLPVDLGVFGAIGLAVAYALHIRPGHIVHFVNSLHIYDKTAHLSVSHEQALAKVYLTPKETYDAPFLGWDHIRFEAQKAVHNAHEGRWSDLLHIVTGVSRDGKQTGVGNV